MNKILKITGVLFFSAVLAFAAEDPVALIKKNNESLQALLKKAKNTSSETEQIKTLINDAFDFEMLSQKSLPTKTWNEMDAAARKNFVTEFRRMVRNSSAKKLEMYRSDSTHYEKPKIKGDEARVVTYNWYKGKETVLEYRLSLENGQWKAWDLIIDDLSTARNYKEQFSKILETKTVPELINIIKENADKSE
ncbi:MAG: ABC transporter substrate-binding protein [Fibrobacter sp.]|jgi:phospholipid transport system substrate-binding protein|nr:ABC transporter substrate-binding protein [Fibrobacter sp.]